jgi:hypothetical protein
MSINLVAVQPNLALREVGEAFSTLYRCDGDPGASVELRDAPGKRAQYRRKRRPGSDLEDGVF